MYLGPFLILLAILAVPATFIFGAKTCPHCRRRVHLKAIKCPHCCSELARRAVRPAAR
jgi:hypothetical protein